MMPYMHGPYRLPRGGQVDRARQISFRFNGRAYTGCCGDTLASALLSNGVRTVSRSFKFHRPRGIFSCGVEEPNALLQLGEKASAIPSERAPTIELVSNLTARSQAGWPSVNWDLGRALDLVAPLWAAGFYNKTFIWPGWQTYEPAVRRLTGLGSAPAGRDPDRYEIGNLHCDVLVVGGGIAGLSAAVKAATQGTRVVLVEQDFALGGRAAWDGSLLEGGSAITWIDRMTTLLALTPDVTVLTRTAAVAYYDHNVVGLLERPAPVSLAAPRERYWVVRTKRVILATGALEQPLIFSQNDRPGIMLAGAAHQYARRYGVAPGHRTLLATNNDSAYSVARDLKEAGVSVLGIVDSRRHVAESLRASMRSLSIDVLHNAIPVDTAGFSGLRRVTVGRISADGRSVGNLRSFRCDALAVSGGWSPNLHLYAQAGGKLAYDEACGALQPSAHHSAVEIVGTATARKDIGPRVSPVGSTRRQWVDLLHDVTVADLELAVRENYSNIEHVKRYTTAGMAPDQGKTSTAATLQLVSALRGIPTTALGHTTLRPPFLPVSLGAIAGREIGERFSPSRLLPMHDWHLAHGALIQDFGEWRRPVAYRRSAECRNEATVREARAVRAAAGLFDGSPLGKIEVHGPDALEFLDRIYMIDLRTLRLGRIRYGLMLRDTGVIFDDGTVIAISPDRVLITTTSGNAARVCTWLEEWHQCEWPELRIAIFPVTDQWATISLAGPKARSILSKLNPDIDISASAFPHLTLREVNLLGTPARIARVSYTGELTYEINVPSNAGADLWAALFDAGAADGLEPIGLDAILLLRLEKGYLHIGTDTDGTTIPDDVGWGKAAISKTRDYIGRRSLSLPHNRRPDRLQLVGLTCADHTPFAIGSHLRVEGSDAPTDGWITSAGRSVITGETIALALVRQGRSHVGSEVAVYDAGTKVSSARIAKLPFLDPLGERLNA